MTRMKRKAGGTIATSLTTGILLAALLIVSWSEDTSAQSVQPSAEQMRMINQLPPVQRQKALDALRQFESQQKAQSNQDDSASGRQNASRSVSKSQTDAQLGSDLESLRVKAGSSLVITLTPKIDLTDRQLKGIDEDPALSRIVGSHYFELNESGVLVLPGLGDITLLGLTVEEIVERLGAEQALAPFTIQASILGVAPIGSAALEPFGYSVFETLDEGFEPIESGPVPADYVLGPGDTVRLQLFGNINNSYDLEVSRDGMISIPEIGPMNVAGLSFAEFRSDLDRVIQQSMIGTQASAVMGSLRTIRVFVMGDVNRPGSYVVSSMATISSSLYRSGGISRVGSLRNIQLKRRGETVTTFDLYDLLLNGDTSNDAKLQQGDVIFVPPVGLRFSIGGAVRRPAIYEANGAITLARAVELAGGLMPDAFPRSSTVERIDGDKARTVLSVNLDSSAGRSVQIQSGDLLMVPKVLPDLTQSVNLEGHVRRPGPREWHEGMRLANLLPTLDMLDFNADSKYVLIRRERMPDRRIQILSADLSAAIAAPQSDSNLALQPRDTVHVFNLEFGRQRIIAPILEELRLHADASSPYREVRVAGSVRAPGAYPLEQNMRIGDLIRAGGNLSEGAFLDDAELTRFTVQDGESRTKEVLKIDLRAALNGDSGANLLLAPYDHLRVNRVPNWNSDWSVTLEGEVRFPGEYQIHRGETLRQVLERAGGMTEQAFAEGAIFLREDLKAREQEQMDILARRIEGDIASQSLESLDSTGSEALQVGQALLKQLRETEAVGRLVIDLNRGGHNEYAAGSDIDVELRDGDRLLIPGVSQEVTVIGEAQYPTSHLYKHGLSRDDYISFSGGLTRKADAKLIYVVRASGAVVSSNRSKWFRRDVGTEIRPGDTIVVPVETDRIRPLTFWTNVSQIFYQSAIAIAAIKTFDR